MITDRRALADDFIPHEVVHRDPEIQVLADTLEPIIKGDEGRDSFLFGPPGTGKTCISQYVIEQLEQENPELRYQYINCWEDYSRFRVLYEALRGVGRTLDVHRQSTPTDELLSRLKDNLDRPYVLILDEVDQLDDDKVLYDLYTLPNITLIMIATKETALHRIDERIRSRLMGAERIGFESYDADQLTDILSDRAEWGLHPGAIDKSKLRKIALSADGDARIAIAILRNAAQKAESQGEDEITRDIIQDAVPDAREEDREKSIDMLNKHQQKLYEIIEDEGIVEPGDLYSRYKKEVDDPKSERALRKYLNKMIHYNVIDAEGEGRWRRYKSKDRDSD